MKIVIRPLNISSWAGVTRYKNCHLDLQPYLLRNGQRYTGLNEKEDEKVKEKLAEQLHTDLNTNSIFWDTFFIRLTEEDLILDTSDPFDNLRYYFIKNHMKVKKSATEPNAGAYAMIIDEDAVAQKENLIFDIEQEVYTCLSKMSPDDLRNALRLYGVNADATLESVAKKKLRELAKADPIKFKTIWIDNKSRGTQVMIEKALIKNIIRRAGMRYTYGTEDLGMGVEEVIAKLDNNKHQDIKIAILKQLE
jgi:hypothetical protein